jgi:hypothetical protein
MRELDETPLDQGHELSPRLDPPRRPGGGGWIFAVVALLLLAAGGWYWSRRERTPQPAPPAVGAPAPAIAESAPAAPGATEPDFVLPPLGASDAVVRELVARLSAHPRLLAWLAHDELIRRFVATVANLAEGTSPNAHLRFAIPGEPFLVREVEGRLQVDPASYRRYDLLADIVVSLDTPGAAELYRRLRPLCERAYGELGYPETGFHEALERALARLLAVRVPEGPVEIVPSATVYAYADPGLQESSAAAKHLLRLGPGNATRIQAKLRELAASL